jgi:hypothetical protein
MHPIEVSCTCFPSPPGGTTRCEGGQIAICASDGGECEGVCVTVASDLAPLDYAAQLLSAVVREGVSAGDLEKDAEECVVILNLLLESSDQNKPVNFRFNGQSHRVSVGLTKVAKKKLGDATRTLASNREPPTSSSPSRPNIQTLSSGA